MTILGSPDHDETVRQIHIQPSQGHQLAPPKSRGYSDAKQVAKPAQVRCPTDSIARVLGVIVDGTEESLKVIHTQENGLLLLLLRLAHGIEGIHVE